MTALLAMSCAALLGCGAGRSRLQGYPTEAHALGLAQSMTDQDLVSFGREECQAAGAAARDHGDALLKFKADHVAADYSRNDQTAIEMFRVLFVATGHLVCPRYDSLIRHASRPLL